MEPSKHDQSDADLTQLISRASGGDRLAEGQLLEVVYGQLHAIAQRHMSGERVEHTLGATGIVHEAFVRLFRPSQDDAQLLGALSNWSSRRAFFHAAAETMRRVLIDHARKRMAQRRGGPGVGQSLRAAFRDGIEVVKATGSRRIDVPLDLVAASCQSEPQDLLSLADAIVRLTEVDNRAGEVVRLRFYVGLEIEQIAHVLGTSDRTVKRDWQFARAWLAQELSRHESRREAQPEEGSG